jgi:regulation of enolase protein 1 (concanavalin A-like superfamily)
MNNLVEPPDEALVPDNRVKEVFYGGMDPDSSDFRRMNQTVSGGFVHQYMQVEVGQGTDFFADPVDSTSIATAPFVYEEVVGDFVAKAYVRPDFGGTWNAVSLMAMQDRDHWIKFAFEESDATGPSVVTGVTRGVSDDANGAFFRQTKALWLKLVRKGSVYAMHWSLDDKHYYMARLAAMPAADTVKVGVSFQCPVDSTAYHDLIYYGLENKTVEDLRNLNG